MSEVLALILGLLAHMYFSTNVSSWETLVLHKAKGSISQAGFSQTCVPEEKSCGRMQWAKQIHQGY